MDKATKRALVNDSRKCREASAKLILHAERIDALLEGENEIASLLFSDDASMELPLLPGTNGSNGTHATSEKEIHRFKRVIGTMTQAQACAAVLERSKVPMTTGEIIDMIKDLGLPVVLPKNVHHLGAVLSRTREKFMTKGKGKWVLREESTA